MEIDSSGDSCWLYDYGFDDISVAAAADFMVADSADFTWVPSNMKWVWFCISLYIVH